jgi:hypothetical protein
MSGPRSRGALIATARAHEVQPLRALLDSIDAELARAWVVLQDVPGHEADAIAAHPAVARVLPADLLPLSHARNLALHEVFQDATDPDRIPTFVGFPDADGLYAPGALDAVVETLATGVDVIVGRYGPSDGPIDIERFPDTPGELDWGGVRSRATSVTLFVSGRAAIGLGYVMPYLGLGTPWPAGEDVEYALRALKRGYTGRYVPAAVTHHPYGTELDPARRPIRYLLVAAYPPPGGTTIVRSLKRLASGPSQPASQPQPGTEQPTAVAAPETAPSLGMKTEVASAFKGVQPSVVRRLRSFAAATPAQQWVLVQRDGRTGAPPSGKGAETS